MTLSGAGRRVVRTPESAPPGVLEAFRLDPSSVELVMPLISGSGLARGFRIRADGQDWALKRYTSRVAVKRLETSHQLELRLAGFGFPVAPLHVADTGETVVRAGPVWYSLHRWVDGQHVSIADRDAVIGAHPHLMGELAAMIAALHMFSGQVPEDGEDPDVDRLLRVPHANARRNRRRLLSRWQVLRMKPRKSDFDRWILRVFPEVASRAEELAAESISHRVDRSQVGLIHNDVNWENLILDEELHVRALLDFDNAVRAPWVLEVGACAVVLVGTDPRQIEEFVSGYEATADTTFDRDLIRLGMELKCVRSIVTSVLSHLDGGTATDRIAPWCHHLHESFRLVRQG